MASGTIEQELRETQMCGAGRGPGFVHLHVHSAYSLLEGAIPLARLVDLAVADGQPAIAVTDRNNLFGALEFSEKAAGKGLQPIAGVTLAVDFGRDEAARQGKSDWRNAELPSIVLLAMDEEGFANLSRLVSAAHLGSGDDLQATSAAHGPHARWPQVREANAGLILLSGGPDGPLDRSIAAGHSDAAGRLMREMIEVFGDRFYVELQRHGRDAEARRRQSELVSLAYANGAPLVATNEPYFATRGDHDAHDALIAIAQGTVVAEENRRKLTAEHHFKSRAEMALLFADLPEALDNTIEIARRCHWRVRPHAPILPNFAAADGGREEEVAAEAQELRRQAQAGLEARLSAFPPAPGFSEQDYRARLEHELKIIGQMGYPGYFLIVSDFIKWAKQHEIPVGPGRGSGAGSLVAWALTITDIDPMRFTLLFERFLNPERVSMPDFDIDFCQDRREEVIRYVQEKYGRGQVAQIITFGTLQARAVLRDVGRVLQMPYGQVDRLAKLVPANPANPVTLKQAIEGEPRLQEAAKSEEIVARLFDIAQRLEGLYRHASTHAAGIVIGDRPLEELVPLYRDPRSDMPVTQYSMKWAEAAGLVKFDFLGLKTLTVLEKTVGFLAMRGVEVDLAAIPLDDQHTYEMLGRGETVGVFQLESAGMRKALAGMKPDRFEDIIALVALYRPGPMDNIPVYNDRKNGKEKPEYVHEMLEAVLKETHGVIIYQEQVMEIARILAGYSLGEADLLRRAMGKKIRAEMDQQRERFVTGAVANGVSKGKANEIFEMLAKFADYGFNKSHAAAYALVSYQTAYLKAHYPVEFLAASMQLDLSNTDKLSTFMQEARHLGVEVAPPSVTHSRAGFHVENGRILYALAAIKGVGEGAVGQIVAEREGNGPFRDLTDFFTRLDIRQVNRKTLESLICAGALDCFGEMREALLAGMDRLTGLASRMASDRETGQNDIFAAMGAGRPEPVRLQPAQPWPPAERLQREFQAMGFYLSAHPLDEYRATLERMRVQSWAEFEKSVRAGASAGRLAGAVVSRSERKTRMGKSMATVQFSDTSGQFEAVLFEEGLRQFRDLLETGNAVLLGVAAEMRPEGPNLRIQSVEPLADLAKNQTHNLRIFLRDAAPVERVTPIFSAQRRDRGGRISFVLVRDNGAREIEVELKDRFQVTPQIASALRAVPGVLDVEIA
jgi:DNA polymerase-3 subunit alpha